MKKWIVAIFAVSALCAWALNVGDPAPDFEAESTGGTVRLSDYAGKWLVLYFFPKAGTTLCTREACSMRDGHDQLSAENAVVLGCSFDSLAEQKKFKAEQNLNFELISDTNRVLAKAYGAQSKFLPIPDRKTFVISPDGKIARIITKVDVSGHAGEVAGVLKELQTQK